MKTYISLEKKLKKLKLELNNIEKTLKRLSKDEYQQQNFLTRFEVSRLLNVTIVEVYRLTKEEKLKAYKPGRAILYCKKEVELFIKENL